MTKKVYVFGITGKRGLKQKDTIQNSIYKKISIYFPFKKPFLYGLMQVLVIIVNLDIVFLETDDAY